MKKLGKAQIRILTALIDLWHKTDDPINVEMITRHTGVGDSQASYTLGRLVVCGYVEKIRYRYNKIELKPLRYPDGSDFLAAWNPPPPTVKKNIIQIPNIHLLIRSEKERLIREKRMGGRSQ